MKCRVCRGPAVIDIRRHNAHFCAEHFLRLCRDQVAKAINTASPPLADAPSLVGLDARSPAVGPQDAALRVVLSGTSRLLRLPGAEARLGLGGGWWPGKCAGLSPIIRSWCWGRLRWKCRPGAIFRTSRRRCTTSA